MILQRLKQFIDVKGLTIASFEKSIGMSNASFGKSLKNNGAIGSDKLENILSVYPEINPIWLLTGRGFMLFNNIQEHGNLNGNPNGNLNPISPPESGKTTSTNLEKGENTPSIYLPDSGKTICTKIIEFQTNEQENECNQVESEVDNSIVSHEKIKYLEQINTLYGRITSLQELVITLKDQLSKQTENIESPTNTKSLLSVLINEAIEEFEERRSREEYSDYSENVG